MYLINTDLETFKKDLLTLITKLNINENIDKEIDTLELLFLDIKLLSNEKLKYFIKEILLKLTKTLLFRNYPIDENFTNKINKILKYILSICIDNLENNIVVIDTISEIFNENTLFYQIHGREPSLGIDINSVEDTDELIKFRSELKTFIWVDVLNNKGIWIQGQIINENERIYQVTLPVIYGAEKPTAIVLPKNSTRLAPLNSRTQKPIDKWRSELTEGSTIDALDTVNKWFTGAVKEVLNDQLLICYDGWSSKYEEWLPRYSERIAPYLSNAIGGKQKGGVPLFCPDKNLNDHCDPDNVAAIFRGREWGSYYLSENINYFESKSGFELILNSLRSHSPSFHVDYIKSVCVAVSRPLKIYSLPFATRFLNEFHFVVLNTILTLTDVELRSLTKNTIDEIIQYIEKILKRVAKEMSVLEMIDKFSLNIALKLFRSPIVERRLNGLHTINEHIALTRRSGFSSQPIWISSKFLLPWISENFILEDIFSARKGHPELIKRSSDIFKFICSEKDLKIEHLNIIWDSMESAMRQNEIATLAIIYKVLDDIAWQLDAEHLNYLFNRLNSIPPNEYLCPTIDLVKELSRFTYKVGPTVAIKALDILWNLIHDNNLKNVSTEVANYARLKFEEVVVVFSVKDFRYSWILKFIESIKVFKTVVPCLQLLLKVVDNFPENSNSLDSINRSALLIKLQNEHNLFDALFADIEQFKANATALFQTCGPNNAELSCDLIDSYITSGRYSFIDNVNERLFALRLLFSWCRDFKLTFNHVNLLWDCFYRTALTSAEQNSVINWFKGIAGSSNEPQLLEFEVAHYFYENKLLIDLTPALITLEGFLTIKQYFLLINSQLNSVCIINSNKNLSEFFVTNYNNLVGLDYIWLLALEVVDVKVLSSALEFLSLLHEKLSPDLQHTIVDIRKSYIKKCFEFLKECITLQNYQKMIRCLSLITSLLDSSEKKGFGGSRSHGALLRGVPIVLHVEHSLAKSNKASKFELKFSLNDSLWDLRMKIAKELSLPCDSIRMISNAVELVSELNSKMLHELKFKNNQKVMVATRSNQSLEVELLFNKELTLEAANVLTEIFELYSSVTLDSSCTGCKINGIFNCKTNGTNAGFNESDSDDEYKIAAEKLADASCNSNLTSSVKYFTRADMAKYILACGANESCASESRLNCIFSQYCQSPDLMNVTGFQRFYRDAVIERPSAVWNDINVHGYRYDLRKESAVAEEEANMLNTSQALNLPRSIISSTPEYFNSLFDALYTPDLLVTTALWSLLQRLPTNFELLNSLTTLDFVNSSTIDWGHFLDSKNIFKLLYSLQIIESLTEPVRPSHSKNNIDDHELISSRGEWRRLFISSGGFVHLYNILANSSQGYDSLLDAVSEIPFKPCIYLLLKIFSNFILASMATNSVSFLKSIDSLSKLILHELDRNKNIVEDIKVPEKIDVDDYLDFDVPNNPTENGTNEKNVKNEDLLDAHSIDILLYENQLSSESAALVERQINFIHLIKRIFLLVSTCFSEIPDNNNDAELGNIVEVFGQLWVTMSIFKAEYIIPEVSKMIQENVQSYFWIFLLSGIKKVRRSFSNSLYQIVSFNTTTANLEVIEFRDFIKDLLLNSINNIYELKGDVEEIFIIFCKLIKDSSVNLIDDKLVQLEYIMDSLPNKLLNHTSTEYSPDSGSDKIMIGFINLITVFLSISNEYKLKIGSILSEIFYDYLFATGLNADNSGLNIPKCKTRDSRAAAYELIIHLVSYSGFEAPIIINNLKKLNILLGQQMNAISPAIGWDFDPEKYTRSISGYVGLKNQASTCYMNSLLQQFFMMPDFRNGILRAPVALKNTDDNLLFQLQTLFGYLSRSEKQYYDTAPFCAAYKDENGQPINVRVQQDAQEFFNVVCDRLEFQLKATNEENLIKSLFAGKISNQMICMGGCGSMRERDEDYYTVSVNVKNKKNLEESLQEYVSGEVLNEVSCDKCGKKSDMNKRTVMHELKNSIIFHLKRFELNFQTFQNEKLNDRFEFPVSIDLEPFTKEGVARHDLDLKKFKEDTKDSNNEAEVNEKYSVHPKEYYEYELSGILIHTGNAAGGHYFSYIRARENDPLSNGTANRWFEFNDHRISEFDINKLDSECFGGESVSEETNSWGVKNTTTSERYQNAYMLLYERKVKFNEVTKLIDDAPMLNIEIPKTFSQLAIDDNTRFIHDKHVFNPLHFEFLLKLLQSINFPSVSQFSSDVDEMPEIEFIRNVTKFALNYISRSAFNNSFVDIVTHIKLAMSRTIPAAHWFLCSIFEDTHTVSDLLLVARDTNIRKSFADLCLHAVKSISNSESSKLSSFLNSPENNVSHWQTISACFIHNLFNLIEFSSKHWMRFNEYFTLLLNISEISSEYRCFIGKLGAIEKLGDFYLGNQSPFYNLHRKLPEMGNKVVSPNFENLVKLIALIVRTSPTLETTPPSILEGDTFHISDRDCKILLSSSFYTQSLSQQNYVKPISDIIIHWSWNNESFSKSVIDMILEGIKSNNEYGVIPYLILMKDVVAINDPYQNTRILNLLVPNRGLVYLLYSFRHQHQKFVYVTLKAIFELCELNQIFEQAWYSIRSEWLWIDSWLESFANPRSTFNRQDSKVNFYEKYKKEMEERDLLTYHNLNIYPGAAEPAGEPTALLTYDAGNKRRLNDLPERDLPARRKDFDDGMDFGPPPLENIGETSSNYDQPWSCTICTYENIPSSSSCDICGTSK